MSYSLNLLMVLPELVLTLGAIALMLVAAWGGTASTRGFSIAAVFVLAGAMVALTGPATTGGVAFDGLYRADSFAGFAKVLIYLATAVAIIMAPRFFARSPGEDLRTLYVGLELQSLSAYVLASFMRRDGRSAEAGLKYFVLGALASGILLYGISLVYGFSGSTDFAQIAGAYGRDAVMGTRSLGLMFGLVFVFAGLAFKMSAVPFHMWTPDVYEGAPTPVTAFFASAPKVAAIALAIRVAVEAMGSAVQQWQQIVTFAALASIILGAVAAIGQTNIKRLLAYSSINNVGFALIGLAAGTAQGVAAVLTYLTIYVIMTLGAFLIVIRMRDENGNPLESIASLSGLSRTRPALAWAMAFFMFSVAGIPPLLGFYAKFAVFNAAVAAGLFLLAVIGVVASVIGAYYYLRIVKTMFFDEPAGSWANDAQPVESGLIALSALFVSPIGYLAIPLLGAWSLAAARALF